MGTRSLAQVAPTPSIMAMNANMYGFAGHSLVTPHFAIKQAWWTTERITAKVTRTFVTSKLRGEERDFLAQQVPFGEGLTDSTYMDWILDKCKRLFLILAEVGVPDQIFGCIDDAWTDDDLPIPLHSIPSLELSVEPDDALNQRFHDTQFRYLLRELQPGSHISYGPSEHIPMEHVNTAPPAVTLQVCDRVHFPGKPNEVFMRRKVNLVEKDTGKDHRESFMRDIQEAQRLQHPHIAPVWASYTSEDAAYILSNFVGEHTLGTFIDHRGPTQWKQLPPARQLPLLLEWMHCLADTVAFLHRRGVAHTAIRPSNILINRQNRIAFADVGALRTFQRGKKIDKIESYDYAASESHLASRSTHGTSPPVSHQGTLKKLRKLSMGTTATSSSSGSSSPGRTTRSNSASTTATSSIAPASPFPSSPLSPVQKSTGTLRNFSRHALSMSQSGESLTSPTTPTRAAQISPSPAVLHPGTLRDLPSTTPFMSDIYSLACVFLDILTFILRGKTTDFVKFRTTRPTSVPGSPRSPRGKSDTSFHSDPEKILEWITMLKNESERRSEQIFRGFPDLLLLIRRMLAQNPALRPTAIEVREQLQSIFVDLCGLESLCCANSDWDVQLIPSMSFSSDQGLLPGFVE